MQRSRIVGTLLLLLPLVASAQKVCSSTALPEAVRSVDAVRHRLHQASVGENDPIVPSAIAADLGQLKSALTQSAQAVFACAAPDATPEQMESKLAESLHANLPAGSASSGISNGKDVGTYGTDLAVQVFQLFSRPKFFEVSFRYGIECGDDNLLLVFEAGSTAWQQRLRWDAPGYKTVDDAFGDFTMLTPVTGSYKTPVWRFVVAHGHPACADGPHPSHFDVDLLTPGEDGARPAPGWHFAGEYRYGAVVPRLATTEDTIEIRFVPASPDGGKTPTTSAQDQVFRFHLDAKGQVQPATNAAAGTPHSPTTSSRP